jgi:transcription termination factor NusB
MLIAIFSLVFLLFFGFGGNDFEYKMTDLKKPAKEHIEDGTRRDSVIQASKQLGKDAKALKEEVLEHYEQLVKMHYAYESDAADYDVAGALLKEDYRKLIAGVLDTRDELHKNMTKEEWTEIFTLDDE